MFKKILMLTAFLAALPALAIAQVPSGIVFTQGALPSLKAYISGSTLVKENLDWDMGNPPESCGQSSAATYNITQNLSNPFGIRFESHYGDVGQNDNCADNPLHVRTELSNSANTWPLTATTGASQDIWKSYWYMLEQPTGCHTLVGGICLISSFYHVAGQLHPGSSSTFSGSASPAFSISIDACKNQAAATGTYGTACTSGPYGSNFEIEVRQCETALVTCGALPSPVFVYTLPGFNFGQYYQIQWHALYSQAGCMLNSNGTVSATCYYPGGTNCSNTTCGQLQVWINGVEVVNYTGIVLGYPESNSLAQFTGTISGTTLTVSSVTGKITANQTVYGAGVTTATTISSGSGTTWTVNNSQSVGPISMTSGGACPASNPGTINCPYDKFGIYREYPPNLENVVAHYNNVVYGTTQASVAIDAVGMGPWQ